MQSLNGVIITATGTDIGKTFIAGKLLQNTPAKFKAAYQKIIQTGPDSDTLQIQKLGLVTQDPLYRFQAPLAPLQAAELENKTVSKADLIRRIEDLDRGTFWIFEGAGGLLVPIAPGFMMIDLFSELSIKHRLPIVVVASATLGTINHTLLSAEALRVRGLSRAVIHVNFKDEVENPGLINVIRDFSGLPVTHDLPTLWSEIERLL